MNTPEGYIEHQLELDPSWEYEGQDVLDIIQSRAVKNVQDSADYERWREEVRNELMA